MKTQFWTPLQKGDIVDVVAPAGKPRAHAIQGIESFLAQWGLKARVPKELIAKDLLCANSREKRWFFLKQALLAKDSKMIWCLRGGYGSLQLLDDLKKIKAPANKCFLGFSDITSLHSFFVQSWGWSTLHGPNIDRFSLRTSSKSEEKRLQDLLFGHETSLSFSLKPLNQVAQNNKKIQSSIIGGNLITLQSSFGTDYSLQTKGRILFIEDIGERAYRVDRVFEQMRQMGLLKNLKALVLGQFTEGLEPNGKNILPQYFKKFASQQNFPVLSGLPVGHGKTQYVLPLGTRAELHLGAKPQLIVESGARLS